MKGFRASIQSYKSSNSLPESPCILLNLLRLSSALFTPDLRYPSITLIQLHTVLVVTSTANMLGSIGIAGGVVVGNPYRKIYQTLLMRRSRVQNVFVFWAEARGAVFGGISMEDKLEIRQYATRALYKSFRAFATVEKRECKLWTLHFSMFDISRASQDPFLRGVSVNITWI